MKPEDFILNSDYISLSTKDRVTRQIQFAGGTLSSLDHSKQTIDIVVPKVEQAEFQYMISTDGAKWHPTSSYSFNYNANLMAQIIVARVSETNIQVYLLVANTGENSETFPAKTFYIKETAVIAPDME